jgi:phasin protein
VEQKTSRGKQGLLSEGMKSELAAIGKQRFENFVSTQAEILGQFREMNELWLSRFRSEADLASEFATKLTAARSIPEAMSASQEWTSRRLQAITEDGMRLLTLIQKLAETSAHLVAPHDLVLRILKLRWMGMENEAERMETTLHHLDPQSTLVREPADTD